MDYIKEVLTEDELFDQIYQRSKSKDVITVMKAALSNFDWFCQDQYSLNRNQVMNDLIKEYQENRDTRKPLMLMNSFKKWLSENHEDIELKLGKSAKRRKKAVSSNTKKSYLQMIKKWLRLCGNVKLDNDDFRDFVSVKVSEVEDEEEADPVTAQELKEILSNIRDPIRRGKFMFIKCTAARHLESLRIKKQDIDFTVTPPQVTFKKNITKGRLMTRYAYLDEETRPYIFNLCKNIQSDDFVFRSQEDQTKSEIAIRNRENIYWNGLINRIAKINSSFENLNAKTENGRLVKRIHSIRSFAMKCIERGNNSGELGDAYGGHRKFIGKYLDKTDSERIEIFNKAAQYMAIFSEIVTVDNEEIKQEYDQRIAALESDNQNLKSLLDYIIKSNGIDFKIKNKIE